MARIVVVGGNFAGVTAALEVKRRLRKVPGEHRVTVISPSKKFLYVPSLIWVPFGKRKVSDITFPIEPTFRKKGIEFVNDTAVRIDRESREVTTERNGTISYDYLVVATGVSLSFDGIPGFDKGYANHIVTPPAAEEAFERLVQDPGPVVVGAVQGASCMGAAYEYLFNLERELRRHGVRKKVDITWITPEPFLGHFGIGGILGGRRMLEAFMKMFRIRFIANAEVKEIHPDRVEMADGTALPYKLAMLIPPFRGAEVVADSPGLADDKGFIACHDTYESKTDERIYAAGLAVQVLSPFGKTAVPFGIPKTGFPSEVQGKLAARNIVAHLTGSKERKSMAFGRIPGVCIMDAGDKEVWILTDHLFKPRKFEVLIPNVFINVGKRLLEKYMLFKNRLGLSYLP